MAGDGADAGHVVDVLVASCEALDERLRAAFSAHLAPEERERLQRLATPGARDGFLVSRALLRLALASRTGVPAGAWRFAALPGGRPVVAEPAAHRGLGISLSHTDGLAAVAVADVPEIGIDVEDTGRKLDVLRLAPLVLAADERRRLDAAPPAEARDLFFDFWTLKEAYLKALGRGFSVSPTSVGFDRDRRPIAIARAPVPASDDASPGWRFDLATPTPRHRLAVAVRAGDGVRFNLRPAGRALNAPAARTAAADCPAGRRTGGS